MNKIFLIGRLTKDPDLRTTSSGKDVVNISLAVDRGYGDNKKTDFFNDIIAWENTAKVINDYLHKGDEVLIEGRLENANYEKNGQKIYKNRIVITYIKFFKTKSEEPQRQKENDRNVYEAFGEMIEDDLPF